MSVVVRSITLATPWRWLRLGLADLLAAPVPSLLHGVLVAVGGVLASALAARFWQLVPGALSGFMLVSPILATGLYELSRQRERGRAARVAHVVDAWRRGTRPLVVLGVLLFAAGTAWVLFSALLFKLFVTTPIRAPLDLLRYAVLEQDDGHFWLWMLAGALGSALVFAATAVSAPLLLDRDIDARTAVLASVRAVGNNPAPMALWAAIIMLATGLSMATAMLGFVLAVPWIGHATWHAYRDLIDAGNLPPRHAD